MNYIDNEELVNFQSNAAFIIGYYKGTLRTVLDELKNEDDISFMKRYLIPSIEKAIDKCEDIWDNRYEKQYSDKHSCLSK